MMADTASFCSLKSVKREDPLSLRASLPESTRASTLSTALFRSSSLEYRSQSFAETLDPSLQSFQAPARHPRWPSASKALFSQAAKALSRFCIQRFVWKAANPGLADLGAGLSVLAFLGLSAAAENASLLPPPPRNLFLPWGAPEAAASFPPRAMHSPKTMQRTVLPSPLTLKWTISLAEPS